MVIAMNMRGYKTRMAMLSASKHEYAAPMIACAARGGGHFAYKALHNTDTLHVFFIM